MMKTYKKNLNAKEGISWLRKFTLACNELMKYQYDFNMNLLLKLQKNDNCSFVVIQDKNIFIIMDRLCYNNITYYRLQMCCPYCLNKNKYTPIVYWTHYEDGGSIYVGSDGFLYCTKCGRRSHIRYWKFKCPEHSYCYIQQYSVSLKEGRDVDSIAILNAMGLSLPLIRQFTKTWLNNFIQNI